MRVRARRRTLCAALAAALLIAGCGPVALRLMRSALERDLAADPVAALGDGLHVVLCGAGGPLPDPRRSGPCVAVVAGDTLLLIDAGSGAARSLARVGLPPGRVDAVLLTHFHSDHIDGLGELATLRWTGGTHASPLPVHGPPGVGEVVAGFNRAYAQDARYRSAHHGPAVAPASGAGSVARPFAVPADGTAVTVLDEGGLRVVAFAVEHDPAVPAVGYRIDHAGRSALLSGDTRRSEVLLEHARGVDLLVHEALSPRLMGVIGEAARAAGREPMARIAHDVLDYHTTPLEAAALAREAGAGHLLLYHLVPALPLRGLESVFLEGVRDAWDGPVTLGEDGTAISLPGDSDGIEVSER